MSTTKLGNIINPQVMGDMIEAKIEAQAKLIPYAKVDTTLQGTAGDTKTVPSWNYIGDAEDFDVEAASDQNPEGEIPTTNLTAGFVTFTIKCIGKAVSILQTAINSGLGNPIGQAETQLAKAIIGKVDNDVLEAAYTSTNIYDGSSADIGYDGVVEGVTQFEDEEDGIDKVMFIHPRQEKTLLQDDDFLSADKFQAGVAVNGAIGKIAGCWIKKSKKVKTFDITQGSREVTVGGTIASGEKFAIGKYEFTSTGTTAAAVATGLAAAITADSSCPYSASASSAKVTLTEKTGSYGVGLAVAPVLSTNSAAGTLTAGGTYSGVAGYMCPIIKMEADSAETEYTEDELPAITIFLKKDTQVDHEWFPKKQKHDITAAKYYGVALTNAAKVVIAKFRQ